MIAILIALFLGVFIDRAMSQFSSDITTSRLYLPQSVEGQTGVAYQGNVYTGNVFTTGFIDDRYGNETSDFGVGIGQYSSGNNATAGKIANSGNIVDIGDIDRADVKVEGYAYDNFAFGGTVKGTQNGQVQVYDANAGNRFFFGNITDSNLEINATAMNNYAYSKYGDANAGNEVSVGDITNSEFSLGSTAMYNTARSVNGFANAGNVLNFLNSDDKDQYTNVNQFSYQNEASSTNGGVNMNSTINVGRKLMKSDEY